MSMAQDLCLLKKGRGLFGKKKGTHRKKKTVEKRVIGVKMMYINSIYI